MKGHRGLKLTTDFPLILRLRMNGVKLHSPLRFHGVHISIVGLSCKFSQMQSTYNSKYGDAWWRWTRGQGRNRGLLLVTTRQFAPKDWRKLPIKSKAPNELLSFTVLDCFFSLHFNARPNRTMCPVIYLHCTTRLKRAAIYHTCCISVILTGKTEWN
jgi:hypothetical protein